jgi:hypothetical protein
MYRNKLKELTRQILQSTNLKEEVKAVEFLFEFIQSFESIKKSFDIRSNEEKVSGGYALSTFDALICIKDYLRTARFLKGIHRAIQVLKTKYPNQKINILYAGCGPIATLILPLLPLFDSKEMDLILLDLHSESLNSVESLLHELELSDYHIRCIQADATKYIKPNDWPVHLLITETMFEALHREPQVAVTKHLVNQLDSNGILIPEEIQLNMAFSFYGKEPYLQSDYDAASFIEHFNRPAYIRRNDAGRIFTLNKELSFLQHMNAEQTVFTSSEFYWPKDYSNCPDVCIYTNIKIFESVELNSGESLITNPVGIKSAYSTNANEAFHLKYDLSDTPQWAYQIKE